MPNVVKWFEIPVANFERALKFYNEIFETDLEETEEWGYEAALFQNEGDGVTGALVYSENYKPTTAGTILYFDANNRMNDILLRVEKAGGTVDTPRTSLGLELGYFAIFIDTEGNKMGLQSAN